MKSYSEKQLKELNFYKEWCNLITSYLVDKKYIASDWKIEIPTEYYPNVISGLKQAYNDVNTGFVENLTSHQLNELNHRLKERFGKDLFDANKKLKQKVQKIATKGKILNEEEYYLIKAYMDSIEGQNEYETEYNRLNDIYFEFETPLGFGTAKT